MRKIFLIAPAIIFLMASCKTKETEKKYPDFAGYNLKGNVQTIVDSTFIIDSAGKTMPDSVLYSLEEYKDNYLVHYTDIDTIGKKSYATYYHFDNGLWKGLDIVANGKTTYKLDIQVDSAGNYNTAQSYDSNGKRDYYNTGLSMNEYGMILTGKLFKADSTPVNSFTNTYEKMNYTGSTLYDSTGKESSKETVRNNDKGDPVEKTIVKKEKDSTTTTLTRYEYIYDSTGNWTQQTEMNAKGKPTKVIKRIFTYAKKES